MTTFALVHGAHHGAWCWEKLIPELEAHGVAAVAFDLPCEDAAAGAARYAELVTDALAGVEDDVVLVGHSLAGVTIPLVAAKRPVAGLVYLAAALVKPGISFAQQVADEGVLVRGVFARAVQHEDGSMSWPEEAAIEVLYHDCAPEDARWAAARLRRQARAPSRERCPLAALPDVPSAYVLCRDDPVVDTAWARRAAPERLGTPPLELAGGHFPFISRPDELAALLIATVSPWSRIRSASTSRSSPSTTSSSSSRPTRKPRRRPV